jgi:hypothetical protein
MPRNRVETSYRKVEQGQGEQRRRQATASMNSPKELPALAQYLRDHENEGLTTQELIEQFQEYDCKHPEWDVLASSLTYLIHRCKYCGVQKKKFKPGESNA